MHSTKSWPAKRSTAEPRDASFGLLQSERHSRPDGTMKPRWQVTCLHARQVPPRSWRKRRPQTWQRHGPTVGATACLPSPAFSFAFRLPNDQAERPASRRPARPCCQARSRKHRQQGVESGHWEFETSDRRDSAPVDDILASGDRCCAIRGEEGDQLGDLCRPARAAKWDAAE